MIVILTAVFASFIGANDFLSILPANISGVLKGIPNDFLQVVVISLILIGSYQVRLEWRALTPELAQQPGRSMDYKMVQGLGMAFLNLGLVITSYPNILHEFLYDNWVFQAALFGVAVGARIHFNDFIKDYKISPKFIFFVLCAFNFYLIQDVFLFVLDAPQLEKTVYFSRHIMVALWSYSLAFYYPKIFSEEVKRASQALQA